MTGLRLWLALLLVLLVQAALAPYLEIRGVRPDLTMIVLVLVTLRRGPTTGTVMGFGIGLLQDLLAPQFLGANALAKCLVGWGVGRVSGAFVLDAHRLLGAVTAVAILTHDVIYILAATRLDLLRFVPLYFTHAVPTALYTAVVAWSVGWIAVALEAGVFTSSRRGGGDHG